MKIDINNSDWYCNRQNQDRTKKRLIEIIKLDLQEVGIAEFGIPKLMSGLYIERVWHFTNDEWTDYINWIKKLKEDAS